MHQRVRTEDWGRHFGYLTKSYPVSATEFGSTDCSAGVTSRLINYFDAPMGEPANRMSWTIWSWNAPNECSQPSVIADWRGTPLPEQGLLVYERLRVYSK
jgi:endoglucanase